MFKEINRHKIVVRIKNPIKGIFSIPRGDAWLSIQKIWGMSEWIYKEFTEDAKKINAKNFLELEVFALRNISRTLSYIMHLYLLEGILRRMYKDMCILIKHYTNIKCEENTLELKSRKEEFENVKEFRHMVAAHTVYSTPRPKRGDCELTEAMSINSLLSYSWNAGNIQTFTLGEVEIISGKRESIRKMPTIKIFTLQKEMKSHFSKWKNMFLKKLKSIDSIIPIETESFKIEKVSN